MHRSAIRLALAVLTLLVDLACSSLPLPRNAPTERWAFTAPWDARSAASVAAHGRELDALVTGWIPLDTVTGLPFVLYPDSVARSAPTARRMTIVTTFVGSAFHPWVIRQLAADRVTLQRSAAAVAARARDDGARGVVLDFEGMTGADSDATRLVVGEMARAIRSVGAGPVVVAVPASDTVGYPARLFDRDADLLLVMLYDQHWSTSPPGAIAAPEWARRLLAVRVAERGANRLVAALPLYGYLWRPNTVASTIGFEDARRLAAEAGTPLVRDGATATLHARREGADGWELWVSDAELVAALEREVATLGVNRLAFWRLGLEDPAFWAGAP